jgi:hypothetical protein
MYCVGVSGMPAGTWTQLTLMKGTKRFPLIKKLATKNGKQACKAHSERKQASNKSPSITVTVRFRDATPKP